MQELGQPLQIALGFQGTEGFRQGVRQLPCLPPRLGQGPQHPSPGQVDQGQLVRQGRLAGGCPGDLVGHPADPAVHGAQAVSVIDQRLPGQQDQGQTLAVETEAQRDGVGLRRAGILGQKLDRRPLRHGPGAVGQAQLPLQAGRDLSQHPGGDGLLLGAGDLEVAVAEGQLEMAAHLPQHIGIEGRQPVQALQHGHVVRKVIGAIVQLRLQGGLEGLRHHDQGLGDQGAPGLLQGQHQLGGPQPPGQVPAGLVLPHVELGHHRPVQDRMGKHRPRPVGRVRRGMSPQGVQVQPTGHAPFRHRRGRCRVRCVGLHGGGRGEQGRALSGENGAIYRNPSAHFFPERSIRWLSGGEFRLQVAK